MFALSWKKRLLDTDKIQVDVLLTAHVNRLVRSQTPHDKNRGKYES